MSDPIYVLPFAVAPRFSRRTYESPPASLYLDEPDWEPDYKQVEEIRPRDPVVDEAKDKIKAFIKEYCNILSQSL